MTIKNPELALQRIIDVMAKLRDPNEGCPWDLEQSWVSLIAYTIEEAYEVADAIENSEHECVADELGDLLFQVVFYARIAEEQNLFDLQDVIHKLCDKLELRHPHVFSGVTYSKDQLEKAWHQSKTEARKAKQQHSALDDIPLALPALSRAQKLQRRAANESFDWKHYSLVFDKLEEEILELKEALANKDALAIEDEMGDLLFTVVNLTRHLDLDAETCLRLASNKFEKRFREVEAYYQNKGQKLSDISSTELETRWEMAKYKSNLSDS